MTQEEKAKRYDEVLEELRGLLECIHEEKREILEEDITSIFPELKESSDERIRQELIAIYSVGAKANMKTGDIPDKDIVAWLEKQGEKPTWSEEDEAMWAEISNLLWEGYKQSGSKFSWDDIRNWVNPKLKSLKERVGCGANCIITNF